MMDHILPVTGNNMAVIYIALFSVPAVIAFISVWKYARRYMARRKAFRALEKILQQRQKTNQFPELRHW